MKYFLSTYIEDQDGLPLTQSDDLAAIINCMTACTMLDVFYINCVERQECVSFHYYEDKGWCLDLDDVRPTTTDAECRSHYQIALDALRLNRKDIKP